jgi:hypothetical protein
MEMTHYYLTILHPRLSNSLSIRRLIALCALEDKHSPTFTNDPATENVLTATSSFSALARHLLRVATQQVRAVGNGLH